MEIKNTTFKEIKILQKYKTTYEAEDYLKSVQNISFRKELTKLRISNHILLVEKGKYYIYIKNTKGRTLLSSLLYKFCRK